MGIADDLSAAVTRGAALVDDALVEILHQAHAVDGNGKPALAPLEIDDGGWAHGEGVTVYRKASPPVAQPLYAETLKQQGLAPPLEHIEGIVWHYTDTRTCGANGLAKRLLDPDNKRAASWHACVDANGLISQSVSAKCGSWHAGGSAAALFLRDAHGEWSMLSEAQRGKIRGWSANSWAYGIELENAGELRLVDGRWCSWPFKFGTTYGAPIVVPLDEVIAQGDGRGWHRFTDAQAASAQRLTAALVARYGLRRAACEWTHQRIDPQNRVDPGPVWAKERLPKILDAVFA